MKKGMNERFDVFPWDVNFETSIAIIDEQHFKLVSLLNELADHIVHNDAVELKRVFDELAAYADYHFKTEEGVWAPYFKDDPLFLKHKQSHDSFLPQVESLMQEAKNKSLPQAVEDVLGFLVNWLTFHILDSDKRMSIVVREMDAGHDLAKAKNLADAEMSDAVMLLVKTVLNMYESLSARTLDMLKEREERKHVEAALRVQKTELETEKQKAEAASKSKSTFLANMSHEIRTPMNGVVGMLDVLSHSNLSRDDHKMVETIRQSANSLLGIINDILDFSKIEAGKFQLSPHRMHIEDEFNVVVNLLDRVAMEKVVELTLFSDPKIPDVLIGDALRFRQILTNLIGNAIKFSAGLEHTGRVHVRMEFLRREGTRVWVCCRIQDNGIGINQKTLDRLFHSFEQASEGTTRTYGGTGLGLVISKSLTHMMGGEIEVESEVGAGSQFTFHLPFSVDETVEVQKAVCDIRLSDVNIMLVGNQSNHIEDYMCYLRDVGATVSCEPTLEQAWDNLAGCSTTGSWGMIIFGEPGTKSVQEVVDRLTQYPKEKGISYSQELSFLSIAKGKRRKVRKIGQNVFEIDREVLTRERFLDAVGHMMGRASFEEQSQRETDSVKTTEKLQSRAQAIAAGRLILVAEDNETNRDVIARQLSLLGFTGDIVEDGALAYERWQTGEYGLLLTDLHMPKMDGYELTKQIRSDEAVKGMETISIVALTANALKGEEEHCLELGMNGYLSKPVELKILKAMILQNLPDMDDGALPQENTQASFSEGQNDASDAKPVDPQALTEIIGDNPVLHRKFLTKFIPQASEIIAEIDQAFTEKNTTLIGDLGHKLKSSSRTIGAHSLADLCSDLEKAGKADQWGEIVKLYPELAKRFAAVKSFIEAMTE